MTAATWNRRTGIWCAAWLGYDRYSSKAAYQCLERLYDGVRRYLNFFQPTMKLVSKTRHGAKVNKVYDTAQTPYQRLREAGVLTEAKRQELAATYHGLNSVRLLKRINTNLEQLWRLAQRPASLGNRNYDAIRRPSVTLILTQYGESILPGKRVDWAKNAVFLP